MKTYIKAIWIFPLGLILIAALISCETPTQISRGLPSGQPLAHFPKMLIGDTWVIKGYNVTYGFDTYHQKVIEVKGDGGFVIERKGEKEGILHLTFDNRYQVLKVIKMPEGQRIRRLTNPPAKRLDFPLFVGKRWTDEYVTWSPKDKMYVHLTNEYTVEGYETVTTKAGALKAFKIVRKASIQGSKWKGVEAYWYSPDVKHEVKSSPDFRPGSELISYQLAAEETKREVVKPKVVIKGEKIKIAVIEFQSLNEDARKENLGKIVSEMLTTSFVNSESFKIIEREQLQKVMKEYELGQTGIIDTSSAKQIGKLLGADAIVTGSVIKMGNNLRLDARIIDVSSGIILTAEKGEGEVDIKSIGQMADRIVSNLVMKFYTDKK